jgi:lipopolysaccharide export system ATP-binding protein
MLFCQGYFVISPTRGPTERVDPPLRGRVVSGPLTVLRATSLTKSYGRRVVVHGVDLEVRTGEVVGLLGPNGAGKTTTFYLVVGLARPDSGHVFLGDEDITSLPMYRRARQGIGYLPQEASVFRKLTSEENVLAILETLELTPAEQRVRARALLDELGISNVARQPAYTLSGGERRRLEICRALATEPSFILLDEPFAGIDPIAVIDIQNIVAHLKDRGIGVLVTDHNVRETLKITDRAYILREGEVFRSGTPRELASDQDVRRVYLGEGFQLDERGPLPVP